MRYVDGFVIPIPKKNVPAYRRMARKAGKVWREYGALEYRECVADASDTKNFGSFGKHARLKRGETVAFSWIVYKSRAHRDAVNAKVMQDPRIAKMMESEDMPFAVERMAYCGFDVLVDA